MTRAFEAVAPRVLVHGHYHVHDQAVVALPDGRTCQVLSLAAARQAGNLLFLDLDTLSQNSSPHPPTACQDPTTPGPRGPLGHLEGTR